MNYYFAEYMYMAFSSFLERKVPLNLLLNNFDLRHQIINFTAKKETKNNLFILEIETSPDSNKLIIYVYQKVIIFLIDVTNSAQYRP